MPAKTSKTTTMRFQTDILRRLNVIARANCTSRAAVINRYIRDGLRRDERKPLDPVPEPNPLD